MSIRLPTTLSPTSKDFGPEQYGVTLKIDDDSLLSVNYENITIDVETDEKDKFVGIGITTVGNTVYYYSQLSDSLKEFIANHNLIGHNLKFDAHELRNWGVQIKPERLYMDTMIMSYIHNPTKDSHGLKELASEIGINYPTYKEMVGKGKKKITLDKQGIERVAKYCALDCYSTFKLNEKYSKELTPQNKYYVDKLEMPVMRLLFQMENEGIMVDKDYLWNLYTLFATKETEVNGQLLERGLKNPRSPKQVLSWLKQHHINVASTDQRVLRGLNNNDLIELLLKSREVTKLLKTYVKPLVELAPRVHTTFNQISYDSNKDEWKGIKTGRLSSSNPNLHNIPVRTDNGKLLRKAFIAKQDHVLICADYSQIEYRLLAHFSGQEDLIKAFQEGKDIHEETGKMLGCDRKLGKTLNFASIYGAGIEKISSTAGISEKDASSFLDTYWRRLGKVRLWIDRVKQSAVYFKGIKTILGHWIPLPDITSNNPYERAHWERAAINYIIQGSAAEIIKLAMLKAEKFKPILQIHDELLFEANPSEYDGQGISFVSENVKGIMESVMKLKVPLVVDMGYGHTWAEAKGE